MLALDQFLLQVKVKIKRLLLTSSSWPCSMSKSAMTNLSMLMCIARRTAYKISFLSKRARVSLLYKNFLVSIVDCTVLL